MQSDVVSAPALRAFSSCAGQQDVQPRCPQPQAHLTITFPGTLRLIPIFPSKQDIPSNGSVVNNPPANAGDVGSIPGLGRFPCRKEWQPTPVFLSGKETWWATVHMGLQRAGHA